MQTSQSTSMLLNGPLLLLACTAMLQAEPASSPCTGPTISVHRMNCDDPAPAPQNPDSPETAAPADHVKQALLVNAPAPWKVEFEINNFLAKVPTYTLTREGDVPSVFGILQAPANGHVNQIPELLEAQGKRFLAELKTNDRGIKLKTDKFKLEEIVGDTFSGRFIEFAIDGEPTQIQFMIGENKGIENGQLWNGNFVGSKEHWAEALAILKALKKND